MPLLSYDMSLHVCKGDRTTLQVTPKVQHKQAKQYRTYGLT
jgi:hypothetical protein